MSIIADVKTELSEYQPSSPIDGCSRRGTVRGCHILLEEKRVVRVPRIWQALVRLPSGRYRAGPGNRATHASGSDELKRLRLHCGTRQGYTDQCKSKSHSDHR